MQRREFVASGATALAGTAVLAGAAGCLAGGDRDPSERPWTEQERIDDPDGEHDLYVENHTDTTEPAWVRVVREDGAYLVDGRYELPDERGIEFDEVAAWETTYTVDVAIDGEPTRSVEWHTESCNGTESPNGGSRDAGVRVLAAEDDPDRAHRLELHVNQCDALGMASQLPAGPASTFKLGE